MRVLVTYNELGRLSMRRRDEFIEATFLGRSDNRLDFSEPGKGVVRSIAFDQIADYKLLEEDSNAQDQ